MGQETASSRAIRSVCGSASSTSWAPCEWPDERDPVLIPPFTSCPPCGFEFLFYSGLFFMWFERDVHKEDRR